MSPVNPINPPDNQTVAVPLSAETVAKLTGLAQRQGQTLETYLQKLAERKAEDGAETNGPANGAAIAPTVAVHLQPDSEQRLRDKAREAGLSLQDYLEELAERDANKGGPNDRLQQEIAWLTNRTPEEIEETRRRLIALSPPPTPIPEGKTLSDMVEGKWPGDETDEQIREALERLS
jgi:hypothetical protein